MQLDCIVCSHEHPYYLVGLSCELSLPLPPLQLSFRSCAFPSPPKTSALGTTLPKMPRARSQLHVEFVCLLEHDPFSFRFTWNMLDPSRNNLFPFPFLYLVHDAKEVCFIAF